MFLYNCHTHTRAHTCTDFTSTTPHVSPDLSAPLEDDEEETVSLLGHVRQIQHHQPRRPQIHPSSPAHLISAVERWTERRDRGCRRGWRLWLKEETGGGGWREVRSGRNMRERDVMICLIWARSISALEPQNRRETRQLFHGVGK